jgi:hypothetical protein
MQKLEKSNVRNALNYNYIKNLVNDLFNIEKNTKKEQRPKYSGTEEIKYI